MKRIITLLLLLMVFCTTVTKAQKVQQPKLYKFKVIETLPHDKNAYTQGLFFHNNQLYESTGQYGESTFRKVELKTGKILRKLDFDKKYFVEGSCVVDGRLYVLTWQEHKCFVYDIESLKYLGELYNPREGWGLTYDGENLIMSDGSDKLFFLDPMTFTVKKTLNIKLNGKPLLYLNELEYIKGEVWANVYGEDQIVIINPANGVITGVLDCTNLLPRALRDGKTDVLNGIAYNQKDNSLYLTGKNWSKMYKVEIIAK